MALVLERCTGRLIHFSHHFSARMTYLRKLHAEEIDLPVEGITEGTSLAITLDSLVSDFARSIELADRDRPRAVNVKKKVPYKPGIGPHTERETIRLVVRKLQVLKPDLYGTAETNIPYPHATKQRCDLSVGSGSEGWVVEAKLFRLLGDNGKPNDNMLKHILSPYPEHRSAITDCEKLMASQFRERKAILIIGYDHKDWPMDLAIDAWEALASVRWELGLRVAANFGGLIHPVHSHGRVVAWELQDL